MVTYRCLRLAGMSSAERYEIVMWLVAGLCHGLCQIQISIAANIYMQWNHGLIIFKMIWMITRSRRNTTLPPIEYFVKYIWTHPQVYV
jgi:hypothetical protein